MFPFVTTDERPRPSPAPAPDRPVGGVLLRTFRASRTHCSRWNASTTSGDADTKNATFDDLETFASTLETYASTLAGKDLGPFMDAWFRGSTVPAQEFRYPGGLGN